MKQHSLLQHFLSLRQLSRIGNCRSRCQSRPVVRGSNPPPNCQWGKDLVRILTWSSSIVRFQYYNWSDVVAVLLQLLGSLGSYLLSYQAILGSEYPEPEFFLIDSSAVQSTRIIWYLFDMTCCYTRWLGLPERGFFFLIEKCWIYLGVLGKVQVPVAKVATVVTSKSSYRYRMRSWTLPRNKGRTYRKSVDRKECQWPHHFLVSTLSHALEVRLVPILR